MGALLVSPIAGLLNTVLTRVLPDKQAQQAAQAELAKMVVSGELANQTAQLAVDQQEAANQSILVAGWRPAVGWVCATALAVDFIIRPFFMWGCTLFHRPDAANGFPTLDMTELMPLVLGMLGMAGFHTYQNIQNNKTATNSQ